MSGNSLQIFSVMMVFMLFKSPFLAILNIQATFARLESPGTKDKMILVKIVYILMNLLAVALGTWKVNQMGLLPYVSDPPRGKTELIRIAEQHGRIGWHGKRRGIRWRGPSLRLRHDDLLHRYPNRPCINRIIA
jgi:hypothetical protein